MDSPDSLAFNTEGAWYSVVTENRAVGHVVSKTEACTKESSEAGFRRDCRRLQGAACMKRSTQELGRPWPFLMIRGETDPSFPG
ncbi:MAG: hypothetical protein GY795_22645 [Desulfobacterales bacterium]|nr:hypothetical protein [Desulfobacterales bacterium]